MSWKKILRSEMCGLFCFHCDCGRFGGKCVFKLQGVYKKVPIYPYMKFILIYAFAFVLVMDSQ